MSSSTCEDAMRTLLPDSEAITLRVMKASDLPQVRTLHHDLLPVSYPAAFFIQLLVNPRRLCLVATDHGAIVGFASAAMTLLGELTRDVPDDQKCSESRMAGPDVPQSHITLLTLGVRPAYRRRGIGGSLVYGVVQHLEAAYSASAQLHSPGSSRQISQRGSESAVVVRVQVAQSNTAGKCFYTRLGMIDQQGRDDVQPRVGLGSQMDIMVGVMCV